MNYILEYQKQHPDKYLVLDSDMFLIDYLDIHTHFNYDCAIVLQERPEHGIVYFWNGIYYFDITKMKGRERERAHTTTKQEHPRSKSPTPPIGETIIEPPKEKRTRDNKQRPPLHSVICQRTEFKTVIKGKEYYAYTDDGYTIIGDGITYTTLNKWNEGTYKIIGIENKTKRSIYDCLMVLLTKERKWYKLGDRYDTTGLMLNPL